MTVTDGDGTRRAHAALLRACLGPCVDVAQVVRAAGPVTDWTAVVDLARRHGVVVHLGLALRAGRVDVTTGAAAQLGADRRAIARRGFVALRETARLQAGLTQAGIEALPLKGPVLGHLAYGDTARRDSGDLDLLVRPGRLAAARACLAADGWSPIEPADARQERFHERTTGQLVALVRESGGLPLELHGTVHEPHLAVRPEDGGLWGRTASLVVDGTPLRAMGLADVLLTASTHAACAQWRRLEWVAAIAGLLARDDLDWAALEAAAGSSGTLRMLRVALALAREVAGAELEPPAQALATGDPEAERLARGFATALALGGDPAGRRHTITPGAWFAQQRLRERRRDRVLAVALAAVTPTTVDMRVVELPRRLEPLYVLVRATRLARAMARGPTRRLRRR